jgi:hypothetical protein
MNWLRNLRYDLEDQWTRLKWALQSCWSYQRYRAYKTLERWAEPHVSSFHLNVIKLEHMHPHMIIVRVLPSGVMYPVDTLTMPKDIVTIKSRWLPWFFEYHYVLCSEPARGSSYYLMFSSPSLMHTLSGREMSGLEIGLSIIDTMQRAKREHDTWWKPAGITRGLVERGLNEPGITPHANA